MKGLVWVPATSSNPPLLSSHYNLRSSLGTPQGIKLHKLTTSSSLVDSAVAQLNDDDKPNNELPFSGCKGCGKEEIERGCNGEGRIQGGIAMIPGFGWWPIKAYRPCPGFLASGGNYRRRGQSMDEVAFGGGGGRKSRNKKEKEG